MRKRGIAKGIVVLIMAGTLAACGSSSTTPDPQGQATPSNIASLASELATSALAEIANVEQDAETQGQGQVVVTKSASTCTWEMRDVDDNVVVITGLTTAAEIVAALTSVTSYVCEKDCDSSGTEVDRIANSDGSTFFTGTDLATLAVNWGGADQAIALSQTYTDCPIDSSCLSETFTLNGVLTITLQNFLSDPCTDASFNAQTSVDFTANGTSATMNVTYEISGSGDCSTAAAGATCDNNMTETSSMSVAGTTYNKTDICALIASGC